MATVIVTFQHHLVTTMILTKFSPGDEAARAVGHVERVGGEGEALSGDDAEHGGDAALEGELNLGLVVVSRGKRQCQDPAVQQIPSPARHLGAE